MVFSREKYDLEFKEKVTKSFLKTVSAFANDHEGQIIFDLNDSGDATGLSEVEEKTAEIEDLINTSLKPVPDYHLEIRNPHSRPIIILTVFKGKDTPYYYGGKAYQRSSAATLEVDQSQLNQLIGESIHFNCEEQKSAKQNLSFTTLESKLKSTVGIKEFNLDILKVLNLYSKDGSYTFAGELLADENDIEFSGIHLVRFGKNTKQIYYEETLSGCSLLLQYDQAMEIYERYYEYEEIEGYTRVKKEFIPSEAFKEALANAIIQRDWQIKAPIQILMYENRIEISSPGGLPPGISGVNYLNNCVPIVKNPITANVFYQLNLTEKLGAHIKRIHTAYEDSLAKPTFQINDELIKVTLPLEKVDFSNLSTDEIVIYTIIEKESELSRVQLEKQSGFNKARTLRALNSLIEDNFVNKLGKGPGTTYALA